MLSMSGMSAIKHDHSWEELYLCGVFVLMSLVMLMFMYSDLHLHRQMQERPAVCVF